jgi:hypothetical protein
MVITPSDESLLRGSVLLGVANGFRRGEYFAGLFILGCVSGLTARTLQSIDRLGWADAFLNTFEVSAIVWISCIAGVALVLPGQTPRMRPQELALGAGFVFRCHSSRPPELARSDCTQPVHSCLHACPRFSSRCLDLVSHYCAHALESHAVSVFRQPIVGRGRVTLIGCWVLGERALLLNLPMALDGSQFCRLLITGECFSRISRLDDIESNGVPQKIRVRSLVVFSSLRFSNCSERFPSSRLRIKPVALCQLP